MNRKDALKKIVEKYNVFKKMVFNIENRLGAQNKGMYHEDITQDLYIKIQNEIDKINNNEERLDFIKTRIEKPIFYYTTIKNMIINYYKKENRKEKFDYKKLKDHQKEKLMIEQDPIEEKDSTELSFKVNNCINNFYWFDRKVFQLYVYEYEQKPLRMSRATGLSVSTITRTVSRCVIKLKDNLSNGEK